MSALPVSTLLRRPGGVRDRSIPRRPRPAACSDICAGLLSARARVTARVTARASRPPAELSEAPRPTELSLAAEPPLPAVLLPPAVSAAGVSATSAAAVAALSRAGAPVHPPAVAGVLAEARSLEQACNKALGADGIATAPSLAGVSSMATGPAPSGPAAASGAVIAGAAALASTVWADGAT